MMLNHYGFEPKARPVTNRELRWLFYGGLAGAGLAWWLFTWIMDSICNGRC